VRGVATHRQVAPRLKKG